MTTLILSLLLHTALAADPHLPPVTAPAGIEEGVEIKLTEKQAAELRPWAENSKTQLRELAQSVEGFRDAKSLTLLRSGIWDILGASHPKHPELLMRYVLNRGLLVDQKLAEETDPAVPGVLRIRKIFLLSSIELALKYYKSDISLLLNEGETPPLSRIDFAGFGYDHARFLRKFSRRIFDSSAHYQLARLNLGLLHWDLYRDLENKTYAPVINKVHRRLKSWPEATPPEAEARVMTRQMRKLLEEVLQSFRRSIPNRGGGFAEVLSHCDTLVHSDSREICQLRVKQFPNDNDVSKNMRSIIVKNTLRCDPLVYLDSRKICRYYMETPENKHWTSRFFENIFHCDALKYQDLRRTCWYHVKTFPKEDWVSRFVENLPHCDTLSDIYSRKTCERNAKWRAK